MVHGAYNERKSLTKSGKYKNYIYHERTELKAK